ncbi:MAG: ribonuclease III [Proteobacteria bacterium]|nr:ribonuclease III [Pseudomonadota bacterium]MBW3617647.1 ribonuclease III [Pseudomonadota bacterium]
MNARAEAIGALEARIGYQFTDRDLLERALTHASVGEGARRVRDNERLEFLGDRVLGLLAAEHVTDSYPSVREGQLNTKLVGLVNKGACARVARRIGLGPALRLAPGETKTGGREKDTILGDACEALLGAVYLDGGMDAARALFAREWAEEFAALDEPRVSDPKSQLQQWALQVKRQLPIYRVVERSGPDHAPAFTVEVRVDHLEPAMADGKSRQEAEKAAALALLQREGRA